MSAKNEPDMGVYDAELMEEPGVGLQKPEPQKETLPAQRTAFQLGKAAGSLLALLSFFNEIRNLFKRPGTSVFKNESEARPVGRGKGRGGGRGRMKRWKQTKRGRCRGCQ